MAQEINIPKIDPENVSPLNLAFIGDSVYEVVIRNKVLNEHNGSVKDVSTQAGKYTRATAQSTMVQLLMEELTEHELRIFKRGRNVKSLSVPKSCTVSEYRHATGFEALIGYLFLSGDHNRIFYLVDRAVELFDSENNNG